jgi:hypothetical protein
LLAVPDFYFFVAVMLDFDPEFTVRFQTLATMLAVIE